MKTSGSFDCSSALVIRSINYQQMLPQTGETEIDLGISKAAPIQEFANGNVQFCREL